MLKKYYNPNLDDMKSRMIFFEHKDEYPENWTELPLKD